MFHIDAALQTPLIVFYGKKYMGILSLIEILEWVGTGTFGVETKNWTFSTKHRTTTLFLDARFANQVGIFRE
ncbi:hypothetical protein NQ318_009408 [Aromia moschata]|uniref:Uncharacterized protein n=1 Tax=Aromia moschata TaxID=1265417 RepID=A0AAV8Z9M2_9CUCU|nr:hypothetical protein NQ318_009408 [Aromia moschata]